MQLAARTGAWIGKPLPYLRRVAYLESHGTEWIDTGVFPTEETDVGIDMLITNYRETYLYYPIFALYSGLTFGAWVRDKYLTTAVFGSELYLRPSYELGYERHLIDIGHGKILVDEDLAFRTSNSYSGTGKIAIGLFVYRKTTGIDPRVFHSRLYGATIKEKGLLVRDFLPVLDLSGRPAMYDQVSGLFFYNQGTGEFTWGE